MADYHVDGCHINNFEESIRIIKRVIESGSTKHHVNHNTATKNGKGRRLSNDKKPASSATHSNHSHPRFDRESIMVD